ncbi:phosphatidylinositol N-acetylglucosaminyltransferase subunit gpi1 [Tulasnella sp. UAMH 9824]|nr:phosphatidylinositol N-acetylglucosaminyltransferase subunit gpi1 [Tulasnella sp. UAMH 9824]
MTIISIFWPADVRLHAQRAVFYGWRTGDTIAVAGVLEVENEQLALAQSKLDQITKSDSSVAGELFALSGQVPELLGFCRYITPGAKTPTLHFSDPEISANPQRIVLYKRPQISGHHFFTLRPLHLDITDANHRKDEAENTADLKRILSDRMSLLAELDYTRPAVDAPSLQPVINQLNAAYEIDRLLQASLKSGNNNRLSESLLSLLRSTFRHAAPLWIPLRFIQRFATDVCNLSLLGLGDTKDISSTLQQVDTRMEQATILPSQVHLIQQRSRKNISYTSAQYISFYNCVWLILNDVIIGTTVGLLLLENSNVLGIKLATLTRMYTVDFLRETLMWLDNWPVGLKLNTELSHAFCTLFVGLTELWSNALDSIAPHLPILISLLGMSGRLGLTMILSILSDALSLLTVHVYCGYLVATAIFSRMLSVFGSLWRLFRGKRRNVLRNRTDSWDYDLDQLLLGTILFTLLAFLFPTVLVYYALFALARVFIILIHASLETCLAFLNHFPLFAMMLRLKDPARLPGGIYFDCSNYPSGYIELKNQPISFGRLFFQHVRVWSKLAAHYDPRRLLRCLFTGAFITPIQRYKIRYAMISQTSGSSDVGEPQAGSKQKVE